MILRRPRLGKPIFELVSLFDRYDVKPLLGVISDNQDPELLQYPAAPVDFWEHMRQQQAKGWELCLHGYQHRFVTNHAGILGINPRSKFAGLTLAEQSDKLGKGLSLLSDQGIHPTTFIAPAHSFDKNTLLDMKEMGLTTLSDGYALYPSIKNGLHHLPQQFAHPRSMPFGVYTFCLHPNLASFIISASAVLT